MIFNAFTFLIARTVAQNRGVPAAEATRLGLVGAVLRPAALGIVAASAIASNEAPPDQVTSGKNQGTPKLSNRVLKAMKAQAAAQAAKAKADVASTEAREAAAAAAEARKELAAAAKEIKEAAEAAEDAKEAAEKAKAAVR